MQVLVADKWQQRVQVYRLSDGALLWTWGVKGYVNGQFEDPCGVVARGNEVLVVDESSSRVQVFGFDGTFVRVLRTRSLGYAAFRAPRGLALTPSGHVLVVDANWGGGEAHVFE